MIKMITIDQSFIAYNAKKKGKELKWENVNTEG